MKVKFPQPASNAKNCRSSSSGVALVIVLIMLSLVAVLLVAFLSSSSTELRSAKSYAVGLDGKSLNDSAVNIVISQIQDATASATNAWASQPGMIRTYNPSGQPVMAYKLYSADQLRVTGAFNAAPTQNTSADVTNASVWAAAPDQYVDLNKPVTNVVVDPVGLTNIAVAHYPIISPAAVATGQANTTTALMGTNAPIQGCYINPSNTAASTNSIQPNPVPMPVKWLYILQDGSIATISSAGVIATATTANPIVGRVAFWTDDETCKVNVNTSAEGTFWDRPHAESSTDTTGYERAFLSYSIPAQNEFQRYPGHPATTSLSTIFPPIAGETPAAYNERVYGIIPRLAAGAGTSQSGTTPITATTVSPTLNTARLFNSVDEFLFSASATTPRTPNLKGPGASFTDSDIERTRFFLTANSRSPEVNLFNKPRITLWPLQANTSDPSTPLAATERTAKDKLIAFCSTIGTVPYYFQRYSTFDTTKVRTAGQTYPQSVSQTNPYPSSQSPTLDWTGVPRNQTLFAYLQYLTSSPIPGLGGKFCDNSVPSGGKYTLSVRDQILTEMVDFIRGNITTATTGSDHDYYFAPGNGPGPNSGDLMTGERQVVPLVINPPSKNYTYAGPNTAPAANAAYQTKGFGRFETIQQAALIFYRANPAIITGAGTAAHAYTQNPPTGASSAANPVKIGTVLVLQPFNPTPGSRSWCPNLRYVITGLGGPNGCKINNVALDFPDPGVLLLNGVNNIFNETAQFGPEFFFQYNPISGGGFKTLGPTTVGDANEEKFYPFYANPVSINVPLNQTVGSAGPPAVPANNGIFQFTPPTNPVVIKVYSGYRNYLDPADLVQTINLSFSSTGGAVRLPIPTALVNLKTTVKTNPDGTTTTTYSESTDFSNFNNRIGNGNVGPTSNADGHNPSPFFVGSNTVSPTPAGNGDVVRNIEARSNGGTAATPQITGFTPSPAKGDLRIYSGLANVPNAFFEPHGMMDTPADGLHFADTSTGLVLSSKMIHSIRCYGITGPMMTGPSLGSYDGTGGPTGGNGASGTLIWDAGSTTASSYYTSSSGFKQTLYPIVPRGTTPKQVLLTGHDSLLHAGDWDTGPGNQSDGPYINKPDEGNGTIIPQHPTANKFYSQGSDEYTKTNPEEQGTTYSPNRQVSSAVVFGSLPTGIDPLNSSTIGTGAQSNGGIRPWQTLLFCANPAASSTPAGPTTSPANTAAVGQHPGFGVPVSPVSASSPYSPSSKYPAPPPYSLPPDSALLDFFTMPIVEPYAISEPFSSAGQVNMNYQIVPFTYLTRDTAVRAVLKSDRMMAIPQTDKVSTGSASAYKVQSTSPSTPEYRYTLNPDEVSGTLAGFEQRFNSGDIFRSASEICGIYLVPQYKVTNTVAGAGETITATTAAGNPTYSTMNTWWKDYALTGDNVREQPYGYIYPRLTTKSNSYTVHVWTQTLKKAPTTSPTAFVSGQDQITSEYRGSYILQRYLDPNSDSLISTDGTTPTEVNPNSMVGPYKFRVVATKKFAP